MSNYPQALRISDVSERTGLSKTTIYRLIKQGEFPAPRRIPRINTVLWLSTDVDKFLSSLPTDDLPDA